MANINVTDVTLILDLEKNPIPRPLAGNYVNLTNLIASSLAVSILLDDCQMCKLNMKKIKITIYSLEFIINVTVGIVSCLMTEVQQLNITVRGHLSRSGC